MNLYVYRVLETCISEYEVWYNVGIIESENIIIKKADIKTYKNTKKHKKSSALNKVTIYKASANSKRFVISEYITLKEVLDKEVIYRELIKPFIHQTNEDINILTMKVNNYKAQIERLKKIPKNNGK